MKNCALVLGGYINGLSIIRELYDNKVKDIWLFDTKKSIATKSNKISDYKIIGSSSSSLLENIKILKNENEYDRIVIYPTGDNHLEQLLEIFEEINRFCFVPFNEANLVRSLNKYYQYQVCKELSIPFPQTLEIKSKTDVDELNQLKFPILIKPSTRNDIGTDVFRSVFISGPSELSEAREKIVTHLSQGVEFIASEYIPGDDSNIYAYTAYRSKKGVILNEWVGKKLTQYPNLFGVFSSAANSAPNIVATQGRLLLDKMNIHGIAEPEFKYDSRDETFKLTEINLRSMMWHRLGTLSGVNLQLTQWNDALGYKNVQYIQNLTDRIHFIYFKHEILNLISRKHYWSNFTYNLFGGKINCFAVFMLSDLKPFLFDSIATIKSIISRCLAKLNGN